MSLTAQTGRRAIRVRFPGLSRTSLAGQSFRRFDFTTCVIRMLRSPWQREPISRRSRLHSTIAVTANTYLHLVEAVQLSHADRIEAILGGAVASAISGSSEPNLNTPVPQRCHATPLRIKNARQIGHKNLAPTGFDPRLAVSAVPLHFALTVPVRPPKIDGKVRSLARRPYLTVVSFFYFEQHTSRSGCGSSDRAFAGFQGDDHRERHSGDRVE